VDFKIRMVDYSQFPYNCPDCSHMDSCKHHQQLEVLEEIKEVLSEILVKLEDSI